MSLLWLPFCVTFSYLLPPFERERLLPSLLAQAQISTLLNKNSAVVGLDNPLCRHRGTLKSQDLNCIVFCIKSSGSNKVRSRFRFLISSTAPLVFRLTSLNAFLKSLNACFISREYFPSKLKRTASDLIHYIPACLLTNFYPSCWCLLVVFFPINTIA